MKKQKNTVQPNIVSVSAARRKFGALMQRAKNQQERFIITHRGEPKAIILGIEEFVTIIAQGELIKSLARIRRRRE